MEYEVELIFLDDDQTELTSRFETICVETLKEALEKATALCERFNADDFKITEC